MTERDIDKQPYTDDELRLVAYLQLVAPGVGAGDDPIGFFMASHTELARQRKQLQQDLEGKFEEFVRAALGAKSAPAELISWMPAGDVQYVREADGTWGVAIFSPGAVERLATVATGMHKGAACWFAKHLRIARATPPD